MCRMSFNTAQMTSSKNLIVFDFDWSFVDQDTDRWVFEVLSTELRRSLQTRKSGGSQCTPDVV
jgi:pyridoxal phosphate phosphatase PHOSPHO2